MVVRRQSVPGVEQIGTWIAAAEGVHCEFKEAKQRYSLDVPN